MKQFLSWIIGLPVAILLIAFALANRSFVTVSLDPVSATEPWFALSVPVWAILFFGIFLGLVVGWIASWVGHGKWRKAAREARHTLDIEMERKKTLENRLNRGDLVSAQSVERL